LWSSALVEGGGDSGGVFLPSLLSPLFLFSATSPLFFSLSSLFLLCLFGAVNGGQGGALWRWRGSTVAAVVVLLLWYFFPFHFLFFPTSLMASLSLLCLFGAVHGDQGVRCEERWSRWWRCNGGSSPPTSVLLFHSPFRLFLFFSFSKAFPLCFVLLASVFLFLHSARSPVSSCSLFLLTLNTLP